MAEPFEDEGLLVEGLERAVEQARTKIPDHDSTPDVVFGGPTQYFEAPRVTEAASAAFDSSAVMEVLRGAIDRYTNGDGHEQGAWVEELAEARDNSSGPIENRDFATGYAPDRRRLAAVVVVLFLLAGGLGISQLGGGGGSNKVTTNTVATVPGQAVTVFTLPPTTAALPSTTSATTTEASTATSAAPVGTAQPTTTTVKTQPTTTAPPGTATTTTAPPDTTPTTPQVCRPPTVACPN
jgi:hypothetical protein